MTLSVEEILNLLKISNKKIVASATGIPSARMYKWDSGKGKPKAGDLELLRDYFGTTSNTHIARTNSGENGKVAIKGIPYFDIDASAGDGLVEMAAKTIPDAWLKVPGFKGCDLVINVRGDSMMGKYNSGDLVALKHITEEDVIHWGAAHVIVTKEQAFIKYLRYDEEDPDYYILRSHNTFYQDQRFHKSKIRALFIVKGRVERAEL